MAPPGLSLENAGDVEETRECREGEREKERGREKKRGGQKVYRLFICLSARYVNGEEECGLYLTHTHKHTHTHMHSLTPFFFLSHSLFFSLGTVKPGGVIMPFSALSAF